MVFLMPSSFFFVFFMVTGVFVLVMSSNWFLVWCGLEMNLVGFIPLALQSKSLEEAESVIKYFLVQCVGSSLILLGGSLLSFSLESEGAPLFKVFVLSGVMIKVGLFPFYFWLPGVMAKMSWLGCIFVSTWQKLGPFFIIFIFFCDSLYSLVWLGVGSSLVGGVLGMNQSNLKCLLAYSSISHMGWVLSVSQFSVSFACLYLGVYTFSNLFVFFCLGKLNFLWLSSMSSLGWGKDYLLVMSLGAMFLTLAGVPPLLGFFVKLASLEVLLSSNMLFPSLGLLLGSCFSLYYYISLTLNCCLCCYVGYEVSMPFASAWWKAVFSFFIFNLVSVFTFLLCLNVI